MKNENLGLNEMELEEVVGGNFEFPIIEEDMPQIGIFPMGENKSNKEAE